jgi:hypothetical protein
MSDTNPPPCHIVWQGIAITITYDPNWLNLAQCGVATCAHLTVTAAGRIPLPFTDTGYRSHFIDPAEIEAAGGPADYVRAWLDHAAAAPEWQARQAEARQLTLF